MRNWILCAALIAAGFAVPQRAEAVTGLLARRAIANAQIARQVRLNQVLAVQAAVARHQFIAPVVVQRNFVPFQSRAIVVNNGFSPGFVAPQRVVVQPLGKCSGFFR